MNRIEVPLPQNFLEVPSRKSRIETYLYDKANDSSIAMAAEFNRIESLQRYTVLIPVAAHQEASRITHAMNQYAKQQDAEPFSILLSLNAPENSDQNAIDSCISEVESSIEAHPDLDIRYTYSAYSPDTPIGRIRKDLWDATALLALSEGAYNDPSGEIIGVNHDIDTISIGRHYMRNIQHHYDMSQEVLNRNKIPEDVQEPRFTQVKHNYPFDTHPNIAKAMVWVDYSYRQYSPQGMYEEGLVVPLSHYAKSNGFNENARTFETERLLPSHNYRLGICGTPMETSPRRYIQRLGEHGLNNIWTNESFGANDACRDGNQPADITPNEVESTILETFESDLSFFIKNISVDTWQKIIRDSVDHPNTYPPESIEPRVSELIHSKHRLAEHILRRVVQSDALADIAIDKSVIQIHVDGFTEAIKEEVEQRRQIAYW